ncbi:MAG: alpha/beta hydrolase [Pseudomonadota bacterium]|nr:alpha/beta hydrolase [Pseudomonadota bacterium]
MGFLTTSFAFAHRWLLFRGVKSRVAVGPQGSEVGPVHYYDVPGTGSHGTLVLQHGIGAEALHFVPILRGVRRHFRRIIVPDLPGHGRSAPAPRMSPEALFAGFSLAVDHALDSGPDDRAVVFGNSLGGAMAVQFGIERPERTRGLILASPAGAVMDADVLAAFLQRFTFPDRAATLEFMARLNPKVPFGASLIAHEVRATFHRPHIRELLASVRPEHGFAPERLGAIRSPTLLLWGKADRLMPPEMLAWYRAHLPAAATTVEEPEGVGHCPQVDRPGWTVRTILGFTESLAAR